MNVSFRRKKNKFILEMGNIKLVASNPSITPFHTYKYNSQNDIMYFYYDLELFKKNHKNKWISFADSYVTEFGVMPYVSEIATEIINRDLEKEGNFVESKNDFDVTCKKYDTFINLVGMFYEDQFVFSKKRHDFISGDEFTKGEETYSLKIFIGGNTFTSVPIGVNFSGLTKEDIEVVKKFADEFMNYASEKTKKEIKRALYSNENDEYNYPKIVREHLKKKYGITEGWEKIFIELNNKEYIFDEYFDFITGKTNISELGCHEWHGEKRTAEQLLETMRDFEAYLLIAEDNN